MSTALRHEEILRQLTTSNRVHVTEMARLLQVSEETMRRDLAELEARGLLRRIHGGAVPLMLHRERPVEERAKVRAKEKSQLGAVAASLVKDGMTVFIDTGSTPSACARHLIGRANLSVMTNSLDVAAELSQSPGISVSVPPGKLRSKDSAIIGPETCTYLEGFAFDLALVGIAACDLKIGWMDYEVEESVMRRVLADRTRQLVLLADDNKFGKRASIRTFPMNQRLIVATNRKPPTEFVEVFDRHQVGILTPPGSHSG